MGVIEETKELLSESRFRIKLHDLVARQTRDVVSLIGEDQFSIPGNRSDEEFIERVRKYEKITYNLCCIQALLAYWGTETDKITLTMPIRQISGGIKPETGITTWLGLRWYPVLLVIYAGGIAAVAAGKYDNLRAILQADVPDAEPFPSGLTLIHRISKALNDIGNAFRIVPGHDRQHTPRSEYLFELFRLIMGNLLFLGIEYEFDFDRFEVLMGLEHAEQFASDQIGLDRGLIGRFGWKFRRGDRSSPLHRVIAEAEAQGDLWPPVKAGLFKGSPDRFKEIALGYSQKIAQLGWG
jgi:hypothetical protein